MKRMVRKLTVTKMAMRMTFSRMMTRSSLRNTMVLIIVKMVVKRSSLSKTGTILYKVR